MDYKSINNKQILNDKLRLTEPTLRFGDNVQIIATHIVDEFEAGRPDIIAEKYYRDPSLSEYILKYNNISNPFSLAEGEELLIPDSDAILQKWERIKPVDVEAGEVIDSIRGQFMDTKRLKPKDAKRVEYLKKKASQSKNGSREILPPNLLKPGERNIDITDNSITI